MANNNVTVMQKNAAGDIKYIPIYAAKAMKHGRNCNCEKCSAQFMKSHRSNRMKAMQPGSVDMGNRQASKKRFSAKKQEWGTPGVAHVAAPKGSTKKIKPSQMMHEKGMILKSKRSKSKVKADGGFTSYIKKLRPASVDKSA